MSIKVEKILVPIAFSDNCTNAKETADDLARKFGAEVELLHIVESSPYEVYQRKGIINDVPLYEIAGASVPSSQQRYIIKDVMIETQRELESLAAPSNGVKYRTEVKHGHVVDEILREVEHYKPDMVVMATHGHRGVKHLLLGSVTERIVRLSPVPVLTVRM